MVYHSFITSAITPTATFGLISTVTRTTSLPDLNFKFAVHSARNLVLLDCLADFPDQLVLSHQEFTGLADQNLGVVCRIALCELLTKCEYFFVKVN